MPVSWIDDEGRERTRHNPGAGRGTPILWTCARCGNQNGGDLGRGCAHCGAGTAEENNRAVAAVRAAEAAEAGRMADAAAILRGVTVPEMVARITTAEAQQTVAGAYFLDLPALVPAAKLTVAAALAFYAEQAAEFTTDELPRGLALAWAQHLLGTLDVPTERT